MTFPNPYQSPDDGSKIDEEAGLLSKSGTMSSSSAPSSSSTRTPQSYSYCAVGNRCHTVSDDSSVVNINQGRQDDCDLGYDYDSDNRRVMRNTTKMSISVILTLLLLSMIAMFNYSNSNGIGQFAENNFDSLTDSIGNGGAVDESVINADIASVMHMASSADGPWNTPKAFYIPTSCPGITIMSGSSDPRNIDLTNADMSGLGPHGLEFGSANVYRTDQINKHNVRWLVAAESEGEDWKEIKMVLLEVQSHNNEIQICSVAAGDYNIKDHEIIKQLDEQSVKQAWASRTNAKISECDTCPGYGAMNVQADWTTVDYEADVNKYQSMGFISQACPGENFGFADVVQNITSDLIDGYAGLAYLSGSDVRDSFGHEAVVFPNAQGTLGNILSFIVGYVDFKDWTMKMVEVQMSDVKGEVHICAPRAKTYANAPDEVNKTNIDYFWENADGINVAACANCAGYGVTQFKFQTTERVSPTPVPTRAPISVPTPAPSEAPRASPTAEPTELPKGAYLVPDGKGTEEEVAMGKVDGTPDGKDTVKWYPVAEPTRQPIVEPSFAPIPGPTFFPVFQPTMEPSYERIFTTLSPVVVVPTLEPTREPSANPTKTPVVPPTFYPIGVPTLEPITEPTPSPSMEPSMKSNVILGRPCEKDDDYVDEGGLTVNGTSIGQNPEDADIGTSEYLTWDPSPAPTLDPTHAPTVLLSPGQTDAPTIAPTFEPTVPSVAPTMEPTPTLEPTMGPTLAPVEVLDEPGETFSPTLAPTVVASATPTAAPTARATFGDTIEPCVWEGDVYAMELALSDNNNADAIPDVPRRSVLDITGMKSCTDHYGADFKKRMKLVKRPTSLFKVGVPIIAPAQKNVKTTSPSDGLQKKTAATEPKKDVRTMSTADRRAFYLAHFTPEARAKAKREKEADAAKGSMKK